jgi:hypothetical protein
MIHERESGEKLRSSDTQERLLVLFFAQLLNTAAVGKSGK